MSERNTVPAAGAWGPIIGYSRAVRVGQTVHVAGTTAPGADLAEQTRGAFGIALDAISELGAHARRRRPHADVPHRHHPVGRPRAACTESCSARRAPSPRWSRSPGWSTPICSSRSSSRRSCPKAAEPGSAVRSLGDTQAVGNPADDEEVSQPPPSGPQGGGEPWAQPSTAYQATPPSRDPPPDRSRRPAWHRTSPHPRATVRTPRCRSPIASRAPSPMTSTARRAHPGLRRALRIRRSSAGSAAFRRSHPRPLRAQAHGTPRRSACSRSSCSPSPRCSGRSSGRGPRRARSGRWSRRWRSATPARAARGTSRRSSRTSAPSASTPTGEISDHTDLTGPICDGLRRLYTPAGQGRDGLPRHRRRLQPETALRVGGRPVGGRARVDAPARHPRRGAPRNARRSARVCAVRSSPGSRSSEGRMIAWAHYAALNPNTPEEYCVSLENCPASAISNAIRRAPRPSRGLADRPWPSRPGSPSARADARTSAAAGRLAANERTCRPSRRMAHRVRIRDTPPRDPWRSSRTARAAASHRRWRRRRR